MWELFLYDLSKANSKNEGEQFASNIQNDECPDHVQLRVNMASCPIRSIDPFCQMYWMRIYTSLGTTLLCFHGM